MAQNVLQFSPIRAATFVKKPLKLFGMICNMLSEKEQEYLNKGKFKRLTFGLIEEDLFQTRWGARTIADAMECDRRETEFFTKYNASVREAMKHCIPHMSDEMELLNERCIDMFGCSMYG
jgi:hypothetical protein